MVPRRKLINQGDANAGCTISTDGDPDALKPDASRSRSLISPVDETPTSNCAWARVRVATQAPRAPAAANNIRLGLGGSDAIAAATSAMQALSAMARPTRRQRSARNEGCSVVHGTNNWLNPLEYQSAVRAAEPK